MINIIIVNYNCWQYTKACIISLIKSTHQKYRIFVVDNQSNDNSVLCLKKWCLNQNLEHVVIPVKDVNNSFKESFINIIKNESNNGFGAGNNTVLNFLLLTKQDEFVWLLNPDTEIEKYVMSDLLVLAQKREKTIVGNVIHYFNQREKVMYCGGFKVKKWIHGVSNITKYQNIEKIDAITGASLFTHLSTFRELGVFPENYFMYWEETDFCTKAKQNRYVFEVNCKSKVFDHVGATSQSNFLREYLYILNGLKYYRKYYPLHLPLILFSTLFKLLKALLFEDARKKRALVFSHIDFIKTILEKEIDIKARIKANS